MSNTNSKGASKLASVLQSRMLKVMSSATSISVDRGVVLTGKKLKLLSLPDVILDKDDYSVCATIQETRTLKAGDSVLVVWTYDGEPVVIDRLVEADRIL